MFAILVSAEAGGSVEPRADPCGLVPVGWPNEDFVASWHAGNASSAGPAESAAPDAAAHEDLPPAFSPADGRW